MSAAQPPAEAEVFAKNIMSTYGRYPITMVTYVQTQAGRHACMHYSPNRARSIGACLPSFRRSSLAGMCMRCLQSTLASPPSLHSFDSTGARADTHPPSFLPL